jgi:hypothetical protein
VTAVLVKMLYKHQWSDGSRRSNVLTLERGENKSTLTWTLYAVQNKGSSENDFDLVKVINNTVG